MFALQWQTPLLFIRMGRIKNFILLFFLKKSGPTTAVAVVGPWGKLVAKTATKGFRSRATIACRAWEKYPHSRTGLRRFSPGLY